MDERVVRIAEFQFEFGDRQLDNLLVVFGRRDIAIGARSGRLLQDEPSGDNLPGDIKPAAFDDDRESGVDRLAIQHLGVGRSVDLHRKRRGGNADLSQVDDQSAGESTVQFAADYQESAVAVDHSYEIGRPVAEPDFNVRQRNLQRRHRVDGRGVVVGIYRLPFERKVAAERLTGDFKVYTVAGYADELTGLEFKGDFPATHDEGLVDLHRSLVDFDAKFAAEGHAWNVQGSLTAKTAGDSAAVGIDGVFDDQEAAAAFGDRQEIVGPVADAHTDVGGGNSDECRVVRSGVLLEYEVPCQRLSGHRQPHPIAGQAEERAGR